LREDGPTPSLADWLARQPRHLATLQRTGSRPAWTKRSADTGSRGTPKDRQAIGDEHHGKGDHQQSDAQHRDCPEIAAFVQVVDDDRDHLLIEEALNLAYHGARAQDQSFNITLERDYADAVDPIELVPQDITRVCLNLFGNGFYAATKRQKEGGDPKFEPTLNVSTRDLGDAIEIRIRDNGTGIPPEIRDKLFQPFFTTKPTGEGTGLGLSISYDIVTQQHGGTIEVDSRIGEFTEFSVRLPRRGITAGPAI
jgi:signal transduction histidine kinase